MANTTKATLVICTNGKRYIKEIEGSGDIYIADPSEETRQVIIIPASGELLLEEIHKLGFFVDTNIISVLDAANMLKGKLISMKGVKLAYSNSPIPGFYKFKII